MSVPPLRSQPTRDRILAAARERFGSTGYDATTIRAVADDAGVHASIVMRYYGNKEDLFAATLSIDLALPNLAALPAEERGQALVRHFLSRWEESDHNDLPALLRSAVTHDKARGVLLDIFRTQVLPAITSLTTPERALETAALIGTQILGLALTRSVLKLEPVLALPPEVIIARVGAVVQSYLDGQEN
ncbi:TetR family transcriptional regulator [Bradyrhizobium sp. 156]|nr:TetR family transcriptional regulator [Bradyrhizobium sp. 156]